MRIRQGAADQLAELARDNRMPVAVTFQVTDRCNYQCVHCYQEHVERDELSTEEVFDILQQLADAGVLFLTLMGGEIFMRPDANKIIERAHQLGFASKIFTTGHHVHDKRADFLATLKPLQVELSMYGSKPEVHEKVTNHKGSWKRTYEAAKRLIERDIPVLLKAPVMQSNLGDLKNLGKLAKEMGAEWTFDPKLRSMENGEQEPILMRMNAEELDHFYREEIGEYLSQAYKDVQQGSSARPLNQTPCRAGQQACAINPRGKVFPCNSLPIEVGDLREQPFVDVWHGSDALDEIRDIKWAKIDECRVCELRPYCQRCHAMAYLEHGKLRGPSLEACRHAVAVRDTLKAQGLVPESDVAFPPTWERVNIHGLHEQSVRKPGSLRVIS